jgi:hypothetical protein
MDKLGPNCKGLWDDEDGFYYDVMRSPDGTATRLRLRTLVGLLPLCASTVFEEEMLNVNPEAKAHVSRFIDLHPELIENIALPTKPGFLNRRLPAIVNEDRLRKLLHRMLDENEFWGPYGIPSISKVYQDHPYSINISGTEYVVKYLPAESDTGVFGGNSNWRGPVWFRGQLHDPARAASALSPLRDDFKVECPTGSGKLETLLQIGFELGDRLISIFTRNAAGDRPVHGGNSVFNRDPNWRDLVLFHEYFHGDVGAGIGASHQTRWTGLVARLIQLEGGLDKDAILNSASIREAILKEE